MTDEAPEQEDEEARRPEREARPKTKPKRRKRERPEKGAEAEPQADDTADAEAPPPPDEGRPAFAAGYPAHPELERLVRLFEDGNYADVNDGVLALERAGAPDDVLAAARDLSRRTRPEPASLALLVLAMLLLAVLAGYYVSHKHVEAPPAPSGRDGKPLPTWSR